MMDQIKDMVIGKLVEKLNAHGIQLDAETVKRAIANSPQLVQQIEGILLSSNTEEKLEKIKTLITQATSETTTTNSETETTTRK